MPGGVTRTLLAVAVVVAVGWSVPPAEAQLRRSAVRPDIVEIGPPISIDRETLQKEARRNQALAEHLRLYGYPDYAEVQEIDVQEPFATYEVRIYYLRRNQQLAFGRVHVSPEFTRFGMVKYDGPIDPVTRARLLEVRPEEAKSAGSESGGVSN